MKGSPHVWTRIEIDVGGCRGPDSGDERCIGRGPVVVWIESNDDNDDGYDDGQEVRFHLHYETVEAARARHGGSRRGWAGHEVSVFVAGARI